MPRYAALLVPGIAAISTVFGCASDATTDNNNTPSDSVPAVFANFSSAVELTRDGNYVVLHTTDVPDHKSPYFASSDSRYQAYNGSNSAFVLNPNRIAPQQITLRIPVAPAVSSTHAATPGGVIGIAINGVVIFNQYNGQSAPLTNEINSFDQYNGHPQMTGVYHYHVEPTYITAAKGTDALIGFLLDGFPVYGTHENGRKVVNADLDVYHGHTGATRDYPGGIYHYHITSEDPYINGSGFYGTPGTVAQ